MPRDPRFWSPRELSLKDVVDAAARYYPDRVPATRVTEEGHYAFLEEPNLVDVIIWKIANILEEGDPADVAIDDILWSMETDIGEIRAAQKGLRELRREVVARQRR